MHTLRIITTSALALSLSAISILCCFQFGRHLAPGMEGQLYGVLGGVADALKAVLPLGIGAAWASSQRSRAAAGAVMFLVFSCYSFASELGLYSLSRDATAGNVRAGKETYEALKGERARIASRLKELGSQRPDGAVRADIAAARQDRRWTSSSECKEATATASRTFCADFERLQGELATAEEAEHLRADDAKLAQKLSGFDLAAVMRSTDPQSEALARFTGFAPGSIKDGLALLVALLIELGSGLGLWVAAAGTGHTDSKGNSAGAGTTKAGKGLDGLPGRSGNGSALACIDGAAPVKRGKPVDPVKAFAKACCAERRGAETTAAELHKAFHAWSAKHGGAALSPKAFGCRLAELGYSRSKRGGVVRYAGISITFP